MHVLLVKTVNHTKGSIPRHHLVKRLLPKAKRSSLELRKHAHADMEALCCGYEVSKGKKRQHDD